MVEKLKNIILFGAGQIGHDAFAYFGSDRVAYFADNNRLIQGKQYCGKSVIDISAVKKLVSEGYVVVISVLNYGPLVTQFEQEGIKNYLIYSEIIKEEFKHIPFKNPKTKLVNYSAYHPSGVITETDFANNRKQQFANTQFDLIKTYVHSVMNNVPLFQYIEVETVNRCNGICAFCPVNARIDSRKHIEMSEGLYKHIVDQLAEFDYSGYFSPFSNNEPLLDKRLESFLSYARVKLPNAYIYFYTNGTLFTAERLLNILPNVDEIIVDNYCTDGKLIKPCKMIVDEIEKNPQWNGKVHIDIRNQEEVLLTRGGNSPNRSIMPDYGDFSCAYPFTQMVVRPDGKVSLCCNDALGEHTLGDLTKERILDVWYGEKYQALREAIAKGRKHYGNCASCDSMEARYYSAGSDNIAISIIVPVYNVSKYLRRCLDSCVFQTLKNIEVIVVNDCSPDAEDTVIMEEYKKNYPDKIRLIYLKENLRQGGARNIGIRVAKGKYVTFIDSDDYLDFSFCEKCFVLTEQEESDMVLTDIWLCRRGKEMMRLPRMDYIKNEEHKEKIAVYPCSMLVKKSLIMQSGVLFPSHIFHEDTFATPLWLASSQKTSRISEPLSYHFTGYDGSTTSSAFHSRCKDLFTAYEMLLSFAKDKLYEYFNTMVGFVFTDIISNRLKETITSDEVRLFSECFRDLLCRCRINADVLNVRQRLLYDFFHNVDIESDWEKFYKGYLVAVKRYYLLSCTSEELTVIFGDKDPKTVCVWGCGLYGTEMLNKFSEFGFCCHATDINANIHGKVMSNGSIVTPWNRIKDKIKTVIVAVDGKCADIAAFMDKDVEIFAANG